MEGETIAEQWEKAAIPGPAHKILEFMVGSFDVTCKFWESPQSEPVVTRGQAKGVWVLGQRFVKTELIAELQGKSVTAVGFTGFDNVDSRFVTTSMSTTSTQVLLDRGYWDNVTRQIRYEGTVDMPNGAVMRTRTVVVVQENGLYSTVIYHAYPDQPERKVMQIDYQLVMQPAEDATKAN